MHAGRRVCLLTVNLLRSCVCEKHAHHLLEVAAGLGCVTVLAHVVQHPLQDVIQGGGGLIQQDGGPRQEAIQVPVCPNFLLEVHQLHILEKSQNCQNVLCLVSAELDHMNNANCIQFWLQTPSKQQTPEQYRDHSSPKFIKNGLVVSEDHLRDGQMDRDEHSSIKSPDTQQRSASSIM